MTRTRRFALPTLLTLAVWLLAACSGAPVATLPTAAPAPTNATAATVVPTTVAAPTPQQSAFTDHPNDATQARLRLAHFVLGPHVDLLVNGQIAVNGGQPQVNISANYVNGYLYLAPGTYHVAVVPTGKGIEQALGGQVDVSVVAGHRYTIALIGQMPVTSIKSLVIDETAEVQKARTSADQNIVLLLNNVMGAKTIGFEEEGAGPRDVPYGSVGAAPLHKAPNQVVHIIANGDPKKRLSTEFISHDGKQTEDPSVDYLVGFMGTLSDKTFVTVSLPTSDLNVIDYLHSFNSANFIRDGQKVSFERFLEAIKAAGLTEQLANGGPYRIVAPTDAAFARMPQATRDTLMSDPKAITDMVRNHIVEGYVPSGGLSKTPGGPSDNRTFTTLLGTKLTIGDGFTVNGQEVSDGDSAFVANGTGVHPISKVLLPATTSVKLPTTAVNPLVGTWQRTNSCKSFVQAYKDAGLIDLAPDWLAGGGYFSSPDKIDKADMCKGATEVKHSHFFTANGGFGSRDETGAQVDDGHYTVIDDHTIAFDNKMKIQYHIDGDTATFTVVPPDSCTGGCRQDYAWANAAFYPGPFQRVR